MSVSIEKVEPAHIQWTHIDGPMLHTSYCQPHWLTWRERFLLWTGLTTAQEISNRVDGVSMARFLRDSANG